MKPLRTLLLATAVAVAPLTPMALAQQTPLVQLQSLAPLVDAVKPAVVTVRVRGASGPATQAIPDEMEEFMERFFRGLPGTPDFRDNRSRPQMGMGSGFVVDQAGIIVTNNHVIDGADEITVILDDGTELEAELVGRDTRVDIAVLRVDAGRDLPTVNWGNSDTVQVGDWAIAIGNPLGLNGTVTAGIVSARGRDINSGPYDDYLQVDAAINRGNSGGPLFDVNGQVIGVNTAIISPSGGNVGLGFAIPADQAQDIVADLLEDGTVERGWIGVSIQPLVRDLADSLGLDGTDGALVAEVVPDSPAEDAGLRPGDVILSFNDTPIKDLRDLTRSVADAAVDGPAQIQIWRGGDTTTLEIRPGLLENASLSTPARSLPAGMLEVPEVGLTLEQDDTGVRIAEVTPQAAQAGLEPGDRILSVNQTRIAGPDTVAQVIDEAIAEERASVLILVEREGARRFVAAQLAAS